MTRFLFAALALLAPTAARAEMLPSFEAGPCTARATHIVVVSAKGEVLESWRGDLVPGDRVPLADMRIELEQEVSTIFGAKVEPGTPTKVTGKRLVLFLRRGGSKFGTGQEVGGWAPAHWFGWFNASAVWVEGERAFALQQWLNPGPQTMVPTGTEAELKKAVREHSAARAKDFAAARAEKDAAKRADRLAALALDHPGFAPEALAGLGWCGPAAVPALRKIVDTELIDNRTRLDAYAVLSNIGAPARADLMKPFTWQVPAWKDALGRIEYNAEHKRPPFEVDEKYRLALLRAITENPDAFADATAAERKLLQEMRDLWANHAVLSKVGETGDRVHDRLDRILTKPNR
jgi:hypothetical protein